jgi:hypothetical protein
MDDVRAAGPVRPNLWADRLTSYAFGVEAAIGQNPMRYLVARRFDDARPAHALTMLFVLQPQVLFGTYVRISESVDGGCEVHTFLPTMARPLRVAETLLFDCLPLTDVGYVDLMAWPHPRLRAVNAAAWPFGDDVEALGSTPTMTRHYQGPRSMPALMACEVVDLDLSMVIRRVLYRDGQQVRRWEITERGEAGQETLPRRIRVSRPATGHETEFVRDGPAVAVPPDIFDDEPAELARWIQERLTRR